MHFSRCCKHHAYARVYVRQVFWTSAYTFAYTLATGCAYALMYVQFVDSALVERAWGRWARIWQHWMLGVGCYFWKKGRQGCCLCLFYFQRRWECMWVYVRVYAHTPDKVFGCEPRVGMRHLEGPENPDGLNLAIQYSYMCNVFSKKAKQRITK